jgi:hypothetical protein
VNARRATSRFLAVVTAVGSLAFANAAGAIAPPTIPLTPVNTPGRITGSITNDGRYGVIIGSRDYLADSVTGASTDVGEPYSLAAPSGTKHIEAITPDGRFFLQTGTERTNNASPYHVALSVRDRNSGAVRNVDTQIDTATSASSKFAAFSDTGSVVAWVETNAGVDSLFVRSGTSPQAEIGPASVAAVSGDGRYVFAIVPDPIGAVCPASGDCDSFVLRYTVANGARLVINLDAKGRLAPGSIERFAVSTDGRYLAWGKSGCVCWNDLLTGRARNLSLTSKVVDPNVRISADGQRVAALTADPARPLDVEPRLYDVGSRSVVVPPAEGTTWCACNAVALSGDGLTMWLVASVGPPGVGTTQGYAALLPPMPSPPSPFSFNSLSPGRLLDTRPGSQTVDGMFAGGGLQPAGSLLKLTVAGRHGIPDNADTATINVTATGTEDAGFLTIWPCGDDQPNASNLNYEAGATIANTAITKIGVAGEICIFTSSPTHIIVDVNGYYLPGTSFNSLVPGRLLDSRDGAQTVDGTFAGIGLQPTNAVVQLKVAQRHGIPIEAEAATLNITATGTRDPGYLTVWPCDQQQPNASNLNFETNATIANAAITAITKIGATGDVCIYTSAPTHLIIDVTGYYLPGTTFVSLVPGRLLDTRPGSQTIDSTFAGGGVQPENSVLKLTVSARHGIPGNADTATFNITATGTEAGGYLTVWPCNEPQPLASNLNYEAGATIANTVISKIGTAGDICIFTSAPTHLLVDVNGYYPGTGR